MMLVGEDSVMMKMEINGTKIEKVRVFPYLGISLYEKGNTEVGISDRVNKKIKLYYV